MSLKGVSVLRNLQNYVVTLLRNKGGANAVEYALIMALVTVIIIAAVLAMSGAIGTGPERELEPDRVFQALATSFTEYSSLSVRCWT